MVSNWRRACDGALQVPAIFLPWFAMTDTRIETIKTDGTFILLAAGMIVMAGQWNGTNWVTESGSVLDEPWKWMPMPEPVNA